MQGNNPIRKLAHTDGAALDVKRIFATLQGEGPFAGRPAVFVRLGGCNLACGFCDTEFEDFDVVALAELVARVQALALNAAGARVRRLVVITGGEPLRQNIAPLCEALLADGFDVQIETNGTLWRELPDGMSIVCSPKNTGAGYMRVREDLLARVSAFKFIISAHDAAYRQVADVGQGVYHTPVYVQPMDEYDDERNRANAALAVAIATGGGYMLSLQLHKIVGVE